MDEINRREFLKRGGKVGLFGGLVALLGKRVVPEPEPEPEKVIDDAVPYLMDSYTGSASACFGQNVCIGYEARTNLGGY